MSEAAEIPEADAVAGYRRPRDTLELVGQDGAIADFESAWRTGRLHHAWLLRGPWGIGKATLAYRIARALIAQPGPNEGGFLGTPETSATHSLDTPADCPVQTRISAGAEPRLLVLRREYLLDKKRFQTRIVIDNVRRVRQFLGLSAADGGWRVIIVDPADEMNHNSANALLKFLEEPPARTIFLLVCHAPAGLLPTIRSRCRTLDLSPLGPADLSHALTGAGAQVPQGDAQALAELSAGSAGTALELIAGDGVALYARLAGLARGGDRIDRPAMMELAEFSAARGAAGRYAMVLSLIQTLIARLARAAASGASPAPAAPNEQALFAALARHPAQAGPWADALARISATTRHAVAVNLDPAQCVIDTLLEFDATLSRVRAVAA